MRRFSRTGISKCRICPLRDRPRVWSEYPSEGKPQFLAIGESPGAEEEVERRPFVGPAGRLLNHVLHEAEINRPRLWVTNLISCRPPDNDLSSFEGQEALKCCAPGLKAEIAAAKKAGVKLIVPLGTKPASAFGIPDGITRARGSVYQSDGLVVLPTFHPSFILRGAFKEESTWIGDFIKARDISKNGWKPPTENFDLFPTLSSLQTFIEEALASKDAVAVDIETTGLSPDSGRIVVIGLGLPSRVCVVPFLKKGGLAYWKPSEYNAVLSLLHRLFKAKELIFQNAPFDVSWLIKNGFPITRAPHDVLLMHHVLHPELPHNLSYIVSVYGTTPFWKGEMLDREETILSVEDEVLRRYNARDVAVLHEVAPGELSDLDEFGLRHVYEDIARNLILPIVEMNLSGLLVDKKALEKWKRSLIQRHTGLEKKIRDLCKLHPSFSLTSDEDLRLLIYGLRGAKFDRALFDLEAYYQPGSKLRRDTKKYRKIEDLAVIAKTTEPLYVPKSAVRSTDTGKASVAAEALLARKIACNNRLAGIRGLKQKDATAERLAVEKTLMFFTLLEEFNEVDKLKTTYTKFSLWSDGRCHPSYLIHGTKTGRLSSRSPNAQNIPEEARKIFIARPGWIFVGPDYSNLELRVIAIVSGDKAMLSTFASGKSVHDENTKDLFGISEKSSKWKDARYAQKKYIFGRKCYGGTLRGVYEKVMLEVPSLGLTFAEFTAADRRFDQKHPQLAAWAERQRLLGLTERRVENGFGRVRILLGDDSEIEREALNTPIQGTAADIKNKAMIGIFNEFKAKKMRALIVADVHDQILVECPKSELSSVKRIMRKHMEAEHVLWGKKVSFPVEMKVGTNWGDLKEVK